MKVAAIVIRLLLGLIFVIFGSNAFLQFMPMPPLPHNPGGDFLHALFASHYVIAVGLCQLIGGLLLLTGRYTPLGLLVLGPVIVNIVLFHIFMDHSGLPLALMILLLSLFLLWRYRGSFSSLLQVPHSLG